MPDIQPATGPQTGTPPPGGTGGPVSQGPNDPINPSSGGGTQQPTGGATSESNESTDARLNRMEALMRNAAQERDTARRELEEERRKSLTPEEKARLVSLDDRVKAQAIKEKGLILKYEIASRAPRLGIVDPELAVLLLERGNAVTVADDGTVTGLDDALKALIKERPHLVRATSQSIDAGAGSGGQRTGAKATMNDIIRNRARGVTIREE